MNRIVSFAAAWLLVIGAWSMQLPATYAEEKPVALAPISEKAALQWSEALVKAIDSGEGAASCSTGPP